MSSMKELPTYRCHKEVQAVKIQSITWLSDGGAMLTPNVAGYDPFSVSSEYTDKHNPRTGGYYVRYKDGYESYSPAKAFEDGYTKI